MAARDRNSCHHFTHKAIAPVRDPCFLSEALDSNKGALPSLTSRKPCAKQWTGGLASCAKNLLSHPPVYLFCYIRMNFDPKLTLGSKGDQSTASKCRVGQEMSLVMPLKPQHTVPKPRSLPCGRLPRRLSQARAIAGALYLAKATGVARTAHSCLALCRKQVELCVF